MKNLPKANKKKSPRPAKLSRFERIRKLSKKRQVMLAIASLLLIWILGMFLFGFIYQQQHRHDKVILGTSFSKEAADDLGVDWQANFTALLDDLKMRHFRLMSFWNDSEATPGVYNFDDLDWQMNEVAKRGGKVSLSIGLRQPRWPECHQPDWAKDLQKTDKAAWGLAIDNYITQVVNRYKNHPALENWHLENEYFNRNFGDCSDFSKKRLVHELDLVHSLDKNHQVVTTLADQLGFPFRGPIPDTYSTSLYKGNYVKFIGYFPYPIPTHFYSAKAFWIKVLHNRNIYIHELQLEPWGPKSIKELSLADQNKYMDTARMQTNIDFAIDTGMKKMDFWGAEWWYWRKVHFNDPTVWNQVKSNLEKYPQNTVQ